MILPLLEEGELYKSIDLSKPWNDPANAKAFESSPYVFRCPSADTPENHTTYLGLVGETHALLPTDGRILKDFTDGTQNTALVIDTNPKRAVHWMSPHDTNGDYLVNLANESEFAHQGGVQILFADGSVQFVGQETLPEQLRGLSTVAGEDAILE